MNTTTHVLLAQAVLRRKSVSRSGWAAAAGGIMPDAFIAVFLTSSLARNVPLDQLWDVEYFREPWATLGAISNSFFLWGLITVAAVNMSHFTSSDRVKAASKLVTIFGLSGIGHVVVDFFTHAEDAHQHLWPVSAWRFVSPVSYWDPSHNARFVMPIEGLVVLCCVVLLWRQTQSRFLRTLLGLLALMGVALIVGAVLR